MDTTDRLRVVGERRLPLAASQARVVRGFIERRPGSHDFSLLALAQSPAD